MKNLSSGQINGWRAAVIARFTGGDHGVTLLELLVAALIATIVATAAFNFYSKMHQASLAQVDVSDMQQLGRGTIYEIERALRSAGFKLPKGHPSFEIKADSLVVYTSGAQPVDTILYYLEEFTADEYAASPGLPDSQKVWKLMRKTNSLAPAKFSDYISSLQYVPIDSTSLAITVTILASRKDDSYVPNGGFRRFSLGLIAVMRNLRLT